jgi:hypothetical protein
MIEMGHQLRSRHRALLNGPRRSSAIVKKQYRDDPPSLNYRSHRATQGIAFSALSVAMFGQ